jgi:hypothetical protein
MQPKLVVVDVRDAMSLHLLSPSTSCCSNTMQLGVGLTARVAIISSGISRSRVSQNNPSKEMSVVLKMTSTR